MSRSLKMGIRPNRTRNLNHRAPGACLPGHNHSGEPVILATGETVAHVCRHCLVRLVGMRPPGALSVHWMPYDDAGRPLPTLPDPGYRARRP